MTGNAGILLVDDEPRNVRLLAAVLEADGFTVTSASSGPEMLERVRADSPDLVLLDVHMRGMNGYEVCRRLREDPATAFLPVVMITASGSEARVDAIEAGADDLVTKPFDQQELLLRVRSLVRLKRYHDTIERQAAELGELNRTLEARVHAQVEELERMSRLRRFLSPTLAELVLSEGAGRAGEPPAGDHRRVLPTCAAGRASARPTEPEEVMTVIRRLPRRAGHVDPRIRRDRRLVRRRRPDGVVQRPDPLRPPRPPERSGWRSRCGRQWQSCFRAGGSVDTRSTSRRASRSAMRRSGRSDSTAATTTARSGACSTSPRGCATKRFPARS